MSKFADTTDAEFALYKVTSPDTVSHPAQKESPAPSGKQQAMQKVQAAAQSPGEENSPLLRGWLKFLPDAEDDSVALAVECLRALSASDDPRDLVLLFWQGLRDKDRDQAKQVLDRHATGLDEPLKSMIGRLL